MSREVTNHTVFTTSNKSRAEGLCCAINSYGMWTAELKQVGEKWVVWLPGECVEGTETHMRGFVEGYLAAKGGF